MPACAICGERLETGTVMCHICGSSVPEEVPTAQAMAAPSLSMPSPVARLTRTEGLQPDSRVCPSCGKSYPSDYQEGFCDCGMELMRLDQVLTIAAAPAPLPILSAAPPQVSLGPVRPPSGTRCLVLYGADKQPLQYFALEKDATLIGRLDAVEGTFPDIDVNEWLDAPTARKVSRRHALILRTRASGKFSLRPLAGNTGTQLDSDMILPQVDYTLQPGQRIILGGAVRFKFEVT